MQLDMDVVCEYCRLYKNDLDTNVLEELILQDIEILDKIKTIPICPENMEEIIELESERIGIFTTILKIVIESDRRSEWSLAFTNVHRAN